MSIRTHVITGAVSLSLSIVAFAAWGYFKPAPTIAKVDIIGIVTAQQKALTAKMTPGMDEKAQTEIIQSAARFGKQLDVALTQVADECGCTILNAAAIIKDPPDGIRDYSQRVNDIALGKK